jgi:hypothetical protein
VYRGKDSLDGDFLKSDQDTALSLAVFAIVYTKSKNYITLAKACKNSLFYIVFSRYLFK